jgi:hemoglobin/transferrin/lactoferrin receptor protein
MNRKISLWIILCVLSAISGFSQTITVTDQQTKDPLYLVNISSADKNVVVTTNVHGKANISAMQWASDIEISYLGYETKRTTFTELEELKFNVQLTPKSISLDHVVVSATRWKQTTSEVPHKIARITSETVALQNPQTAADLLSVSGKVFVQKSQQGGGSPMIRGFATNRLLYTVDGVRMNTAIFRSGNIQNVISLDPFAIENTEVFFGPGSVMYGSDAIGGVMSFQTLQPRLSSGDEAEITGNALARFASANNENTAHFDVNVGWKKWALVTSISSNRFDHLRMGSHGPDDYLSTYYVTRQDSTDVVHENEDPRVQRPSAYSQMNLMQKIRFAPNEHWNFEYGFHYSETSDYGRFDRHQRMRNGLPRYAEWSYGPQIWMMNNFHISHSKSNALYDEFSLRLAHQFFEESRISRDLNDAERQVRKEKVDAWSVNTDFSKALGSSTRLYYGLEGVMNDVSSTGRDEDIITGISAPGPARYPQAQWFSYAAYLNLQHKLSEKMLLQGGARYNVYQLESQFDTTFYPFPFAEANLQNGAVSGSVGAVYRPNEKWVISANLSTGFRAPNVDDVGKVFDSEPGAVVVPNPELSAEYAYNGELSVAKVFGNRVKADLTGFYTILENALVRRDFQLGGADSIFYDGEQSRVQAIQNAARAVVYGFQAGLEVKLPKGFAWISDFNYQLGEEEMDDGSLSRSRHAAPFFGISRLSFTAKRLQTELNVQFSGAITAENMPVSEIGKTEIYALDENGNPYAPAWYTLNYRAMYQINSNFTITAGIENLTDRRYRAYSSGISGAGRQLIFALRARF